MTIERTEHEGTPLTFSRPTGDIRAGIVVIQEAWGITRHLAGLTGPLAAEGYLAVAPHLYHRQGDPVVEDHDFQRARPLLQGLTGSGISADVNAAIDYVHAQGVRQVGIVGFCMGGTIALWAAASAHVDAAVTFYGSGIAKSRWRGIPSGLELAAKVRVPWLGLYGDLDKSIPIDQVEELRTALEPVNAPTQIVRYADAGHAFATDPDSPRHVADAAEDAWIRTREFFADHLRA
ncbi:dienelactone hydrolase family protein [Rhodococcus sp. D2-41]|uniref:Dienelactone hydrolase family protein n=1 Tax=Speluncibacter jeojiensis TaxID=2710754 RepID=A0A9X4M1T9_9ACTN|nr:dienelactone hydrolase family protein [Rhodococcus sp. D2-41]MDG3009509.1 dienelactone hydrolase family protein [Rhodococcus sp. D2-41]MDG3016438.1 dienelactone hydrolase family protein [Corynebacteriales bacterium D3-21]